MDFDHAVKMAVYRRLAETGGCPDLDEVAALTSSSAERVSDAFRRLAEAKALVLEEDGISVRMALPFSAVPTQHRVESGGVHYYANCGWDALGIPAALHRDATVRSRCGQSGESLTLRVGLDGPEPSDWLFHSLLPASKWWNDVVFT